MNTEDTPGSKVSAEYIKSEVEKNLPGVTMKVKQLPFKQRVNQEHSETFEASLSGWDYPDPLTFLEIMTTGNPSNNTAWGSKNTTNSLKMRMVNY